MTKPSSLIVLTLGALFALPACSSTSNSGGSSSGTSAAVSGPADTHCGSSVQSTSQASCKLTSDGGVVEADYGDTLDNAEGDDDDCKYHVKWTSTAVAENQDVTFTVVAINKTDSSPVTGAATEIEAFLSDTHGAPATDQKTSESPPGTYAIGPVRFDAAGRWTVRFHFFEECTDVADDSPHGHAAFYVQVP